MNADADFDNKSFKRLYESNGIFANIDVNKRNAKDTDHEYLLDHHLYKDRFSVERTNAWIDAFKILLVRFETRSDT
jgi:hypothetical protein